MPDFFEQIKELFSPKGKQQQFIHETLERNTEELAGFNNWKASKESQDLLAFCRASLIDKDLLDEVADYELFYINTPKTAGFVLKINNDQQALSHVLDYFKEQVLALGYVTQLADRQVKVNKQVETKERYYLKPRFSLHPETQQVDHKYGNITLEHHLVDNRSTKLHCIVNSYQDRNFTPARDIQELYQAIFR